MSEWLLIRVEMLNKKMKPIRACVARTRSRSISSCIPFDVERTRVRGGGGVEDTVVHGVGEGAERLAEGGGLSRCHRRSRVHEDGLELDQEAGHVYTGCFLKWC